MIPDDVDAVIQRARFELYRENIQHAVEVLTAAQAARPDSRYVELLERIRGWTRHLDSREAYVAAQEEQYRRLRWRLSLKFLERQLRILLGRKARKMIRRRVAHPEFQLLEAEVLAVKAHRVLDGGSGEGAVAMALCARHPNLQVDAVDVAATNVRLARRMNRLPNVTFHRGLVEEAHLLFPPASFDLVYSFAVLEHVRSVEETIQSMLTVTRPGGRVCLVVPMRELTTNGPLPDYTPIHGYIDHVRVFSEAELRERFRRYHNLIVHKIPGEFDPKKSGPVLVPLEFGSFFAAFGKPA